MSTGTGIDNKIIEGKLTGDTTGDPKQSTE